MAILDSDIRWKWSKGEVIRHIKDGHPYLVLHVYKHSCTILCDLEDKNPLPQARVLLLREYGNYTTDINMVAKGTDDGTITWEYNPIPLTL